MNIGIKGIHLFLLNTVIGMHMSLPFCIDLTVINLLIICSHFYVPVLANVSNQYCLIPTITIFFWEIQFLRSMVVVTTHMQRYKKVSSGEGDAGVNPLPLLLPDPINFSFKVFSHSKRNICSPLPYYWNI